MGTTVHATCVAVDGSGVLIRGASGAGKSDLALRLIDTGAVLVADDRVEIAPGAGGGPPLASPPPALAGRIEARGIGILTVPFLTAAPIALVVDLASPAAAIERLPEPGRATVLGTAIPRIVVAPFEASAVAKVRLAVRTLAIDTPASVDETAPGSGGAGGE